MKLHIRRSLAVLLSLGLSVALAPQALAACAQSDIAGDWQFYSPDADGFWLRCKMHIDSLGNITGPCTSSADVTKQLSNAKLKLSSPSLCSYSGNLTWNNAGVSLIHLTLSRDKIFINGVGKFKDGDAGVTFTLLKL